MRNANESERQSAADLSGLTLMLRCYDIWSASDTAQCNGELGKAAADPATP